MALKESLDGVSSALSGILKQLKDIEEAQKRIKTNASAYQAAVSGAAAGTGGVGASGGVMDGSLGNVPAASGAPAGAPAGSPGGTPSWASAALGRVVGGGGVGGTLAGLGLGLGAIAIDTAWNMTPGAQDYLAFQTPLFQTARFGPNGYDPTVKDRVQRLFGPYMTSNTDALAAAQLATMRGQGISSGVFNFQARQAASISMLTGMSNPQAMSAATSMYMGNTSGNLARYGIFTNSLRNGRPKDLGAIVDELWARWLGSPNAKISMEELNAQLMGGFIGNDLRNLFGNDPQLYETMYTLILQKGQQKGASVRLSRTSGAGSAIEASKAFGNNRRNNPALGLMEMSSERYATIGALSDQLATGFEAGIDAIKFLNDAMQGLAEDMGAAGSAFRALVTSKAFVETFTGSSEGGAAAGGLGSLLPFLGGMAASRMLGRGGRGGAAGGRPAKGAQTKTAAGKQAKPVAAASRGILGTAGGIVSGLAIATAGDYLLSAGNNAWGKDADELGVTWGNPAGLAKGFGNVMARAGVGALEGLVLTGNPFGALAGAVLEGGYGIYQGFTDPYFGVKGHETPTVIGGLVNSILGGFFAKGTQGGTGSSTSDSIRANLSRGEYVVNARAAQKIGTKNLDALNSLGHDFGSAYASPAKNFAGGGTTLDGWPALTSDSDLMSTFSVPGVPGSYLLRKDYAPMLLNVIKSYNATVRKIDEGYGWRGGSAYYGNGITNHAAGVAIDLDYDSYWGYPGSAKDPTPSEMKAIRALLAANPGIEWGGDWDKPTWYDPMHFEVRDPKVGASTTSGVTTASGVTNDAPTAKERKAASQGMTGAAPASLNIMTGAALLSPAATSVGGTTGYLRGYSLPGLGSGNSLRASFTTAAPLAARLSSIRSSVGGTGVMGGAGSSSTTTRSGKKVGGTASSVNFGNAATGKGGAWLYQFLVDHGLRGNDLRVAWTIGMRESGGDPSNTTNGGKENWGSSGSPHYDVGVFQINNRHLDAIRDMFGNDADMSLMLDPNKNFEYMMKLSKNLTSLYAWALEPDGKTFNWDVSYGGRGNYQYADSAESNHSTFWNQYSKYNKYNYSQGAYRTHEGMAKLHEGEMVLPASAAEEFRRALKDFAGGRSRHGDVHITLKIEKASDAEAERFAKKVKRMLEDDDRLSSMRKH